jgi:molecular chaperone IbpA
LLKGENKMTQFTIRTLDLPTLHRRFIGFDQFFNELERTFAASAKQDNYPPYNVLRTGNNLFQLEVAVAGFMEEELDVELEGRVLTVRGERKRDEDAAVEYLHRGISGRNFEKTFPLGDNLEVRSATVKNGILTISLEHIVPDEDKAKKIAITFAK